MSFVDRERYEILMEKVQDLYRNLGLTVEHAGIQIDESGEEVLMVVARVRETAYERIVTDQDEKAQYNQMLSRQNEANLERRREAIKRAFEQRGNDLFEALVGGDVAPDCPTNHVNQHEGLCLDCGEEIE